MSAAVSYVEVRTSEVEVITIGIACVDAKMPVACVPIDGAIEIIGSKISTILPVEQNITQVEITAFPVNTVYVVHIGQTHQVVQIDFVGGLILLVGQVQFIGHLVC